ncbi:HAD-like domain [Pseudocohnilembus persalinus]|uniref:Mitochondrial import inner membrane translocase subunit TIM50 n=1 Tax=Pseudocohnilembus persalinus TaxID=266149 RepID=A0A0V0QGS1_PSEPJ|nr:HAD-like domain [Pseudocohnilembus persalinus]|eukprot:KRX01489.1 HAD-like domain [Pseudocohnilembus persalinus]
MEKLVGGKESKKAVEKMIIYERLVMFIFLYEIIQNHSDLCDLESENQIQSEAYFKIGDNLNNIYNALNYASQSNLLFMDYLGEQFEKETELNHKKGEISDRNNLYLLMNQKIEELKKLKEQREEIVIKLDESQISDLENNKANNKIQKIQEKQELKRPLSSSDLNQANLQDTQNFLNQLNQQQQQQKHQQQQQHLEQQQMVNVLNNADIQIPSEHVQEQLKQQQQQQKQEQEQQLQQQNQNDQQLQQLQEKQVSQKQEKMSEQEEQENLKQQEEGIVGSAKAPYLQALKKEEEEQTYTLVLDLDETLVHYEELEEGGQFLVRPYAETFLEELGKKYELVIFTAALKDYADFILDIIDQKKQIKYKLYRQHTVPNGQSYVKDLSKLGRDMSKIIIIDNLAENFALQPANGIAILSWFGDADDKALYDLCPLLKQIVDRKFRDVRSALKQFRNQMMQRIMAGDENPQQNLDLDPNLE